MPPAIEVVQLRKCFRPDRLALDNVDLHVQLGEMVALIGASGSGKSTLIRHIAGLLPADKGCGEVTVQGRLIQRCGRISGDVRGARAKIGVIFQQFNLVGRLSLLTNVLVGALGRVPRLRGTLNLFTVREKTQAMEALERVGMAEFAMQRASTLSGGQQQRGAIARTLMQQAEAILADEPIASLDPESSRRVMEILAQINREDGVTVLVSLHQVDYALRYCPRAVGMKDGRVVFDGPSRRVTPELLADIYGADAAELGLNRSEVLEAYEELRRKPAQADLAVA
jgi:phosphonate transport system ATP-binding protein